MGITRVMIDLWNHVVPLWVEIWVVQLAGYKIILGNGIR